MKSDLSFLAAGIAVIAGLVRVLGIVVMTLIERATERRRTTRSRR